MRRFFRQEGGTADIMLGQSDLTLEEVLAMPHDEGEYDDDGEYEDDDYFDDWRDETLFDDNDDDDSELQEDWEFESEDWALILRELFSWTKVRQVLMCLAGSMVFLAAYYPLMRGLCWLMLAAGYWCGADGAVWPGPYTPYPEQF